MTLRRTVGIVFALLVQVALVTALAAWRPLVAFVALVAFMLMWIAADEVLAGRTGRGVDGRPSPP